jgi:hypothetical protein
MRLALLFIAYILSVGLYVEVPPTIWAALGTYCFLSDITDQPFGVFK